MIVIVIKAVLAIPTKIIIKKKEKAQTIKTIPA